MLSEELPPLCGLMLAIFECLCSGDGTVTLSQSSESDAIFAEARDFAYRRDWPRSPS